MSAEKLHVCTSCATKDHAFCVGIGCRCTETKRCAENARLVEEREASK